MGPVAQLVFKTSAVVQPTARSVRLRRRSVSRNPLRQEVFGVSAAGTHQIPPTAQDRPRPLESGAHWRATGAHVIPRPVSWELALPGWPAAARPDHRASEVA